MCWCLQVSIQTGDVRGAGTDADISIILFGANGQSQELKLESSADNFERNKVGPDLDVSMPEFSQLTCLTISR